MWWRLPTRIVVYSVCFLTFCCSRSATAEDYPRDTVRLAFSGRQLIAPSLMVALGTLSLHQPSEEVRDWRNRHLANFHTHVDDVLSVSPIALVYLLDAAGVPAKTDFRNRSAILLKSELMCLGSVYGLKHILREQRPDGSDERSFPSSHTAQAFMGATFLTQEYKDRLPWIPYAAYTLASSVGMMRIANNRHYLSDVLIGAGIGILSQKIAYWTHRYHWKRHAREHNRPVMTP